MLGAERGVDLEAVGCCEGRAASRSCSAGIDYNLTCDSRSYSRASATAALLGPSVSCSATIKVLARCGIRVEKDITDVAVGGRGRAATHFTGRSQIDTLSPRDRNSCKKQQSCEEFFHYRITSMRWSGDAQSASRVLRGIMIQPCEDSRVLGCTISLILIEWTRKPDRPNIILSLSGLRPKVTGPKCLSSVQDLRV